MTLGYVLIAVIMILIDACSVAVSQDSPQQGIEGQYMFRGPGVHMDCSEVTSEDREDCEKVNEPFATPIADAVIEVHDTEGNLLTAAVTDFDGKFRTELPPGNYLLCTDFCEGPITVEVGVFTTYDLSLFAP